MVPVDASKFRPCGGCTVCCQATAIQLLAKPCGVRCPNLVGQGEAAGCSVYALRTTDPKYQDCISFHCLWQTGEFDEADRPDRLGVAFSQRPDDQRPGQVRIDVWETSPGAAQSERAMELIGQQLGQGRTVVIVNAEYQLAFLPSGDAWHCRSDPADPLRASVDPNAAPVQLTARGQPLPNAAPLGRARPRPWFTKLRLPPGTPPLK